MAADRKLLAAAFAAIAFLTAGPARGAVTRPTQTAPAAGAVVQFLPSFAWTPVAGVAKYQFQLSADAGMNSPVLGDGKDNFFTRNTRATLLKTIPNGTYWWRVRAVRSNGSVSAAVAELRRRADLSVEPGRPQLVRHRRCLALPRLGRERSDARLARLPLLEPGRPEGRTERRRDERGHHRRAGARLVLLERHAR
jgi:hypothetical protein